MKNNYGYNFYKNRHQKTVYSAKRVSSIIFEALPDVHSAIDFGCGVGTWLSVLKESGVSEILGLDGPWVEQELLEIPTQDFRQVNFEEVITLDKKYDLAISLEVAEHLSERAAVSFVDSLTSASNFILFSAAIPFQTGRGHINLQWQDYWADLFIERGFVVLDLVRKKIWEDRYIPPHYRQNILLFVKKEDVHRVKGPEIGGYDYSTPISLVHPDMYLLRIKKMSSVKGSWLLFLHAVKKSFRKNREG